MTESEPQLQDYGITSAEYKLYKREGREPLNWSLLGVWLLSPVLFLFRFIAEGNVLDALIFAILAPAPLAGLMTIFFVIIAIGRVIDRNKRRSLMQGPVAAHIRLYEEAMVAYRKVQYEAERERREAERAQQEAARRRWEEERERLRKQEEYWMNLSGSQFEREMATLFKRRGYIVELRGGAGDGGIDILARKGGETTIIQCKRYKNPVGPAAARELYGSLIASGADQGILACTAGFTKGARDFVDGKPIRLVDSWDIIKVAEATDGRRDELPPPMTRHPSRRRRRWR